MVSWHKLVIPLNTDVSRLISIDNELDITEGWIDIIKIRFLTGHHVFYNSSCILQVTMYLTGHHVSYRSPCISQVTIYHLCFIVLIDWRMNTCNMKNIFFRFKRGWWVHRINLCTATFYLSGCAKPEQWAIHDRSLFWFSTATHTNTWSLTVLV
jgi:hypothetical protein